MYMGGGGARIINFAVTSFLNGPLRNLELGLALQFLKFFFGLKVSYMHVFIVKSPGLKVEIVF